jgi:predicted dehydrogenase
MDQKYQLSRKKFIKTTGAFAGGAILAAPYVSKAAGSFREKKKLALVGTGVRGVSMFGRSLRANYGDYVDLVSICDINPGRLARAREFIGGDLPAYTDLDEMLEREKPDTLIVTSRDDVHHEHIITGMRLGCDIITEKPLTIDEHKAQEIIDAEKKYGRNVIVTFNYRYPPYRAKVKELIMDGWIGDVKNVEFHWHITHSHLMRYMQRWHGHRRFGGSLWVHKSTHHFDMVNWFINSDPVEVYANSELERFGKHGPFRGKNCRNCAFTDQCPYYWDITQDEHHYNLYTRNEHYDGYVRDNCVFRETIDIFSKHSALVKYANGAQLNYSLTADTEHEGYWLAFNGTKGRLEVRAGGWPRRNYEEIHFMPNRRYSDRQEEQTIRVDHGSGGHWGGDPIMNDQLFKDPNRPDPLKQQAGVRDGVMSIIIGVAARKSTDSGLPVRIEDLVDLKPMPNRA